MKVKRLAGLLAVAIGLALPAGANASGEIPATEFFLTPKSGSFYNNAFKSAEWRTETSVSAPNPPNTEILPTRQTTLNLPGDSRMTFNPPANMPVCPDSGPNGIGPETNNSVPIPTIVARCPNSIIGNGTATFLLNRVNNPAATLDGLVVIFNGGRVDGRPRLKFWAYSYDTGVAIYTEGTLAEDGTMPIPIPQLTSDSAVNSLNVNIPGETQEIFIELLQETVILPGGQAPNYVQAKCVDGIFPYSADFLLGRRLTDGTPTGPQETFNDVGEDTPCTGITATARLAKPTVSGPGTARVGKVATYRVNVRNAGGLPVSGVRLKVAGKGVAFNTSVGTIAGESSRTVTVRAKFRSKGTIRATFTASSSNGGTQKTVKTIRVR